MEVRPARFSFPVSLASPPRLPSPPSRRRRRRRRRLFLPPSRATIPPHNGPRRCAQEVRKKRRYSTFNDRSCGPLCAISKGYNYAHLCHARISPGFVRRASIILGPIASILDKTRRFLPFPSVSLPLPPSRGDGRGGGECVVHRRTGWRLIKTRANRDQAAN